MLGPVIHKHVFHSHNAETWDRWGAESRFSLGLQELTVTLSTQERGNYLTSYIL